MTTIAKPGVYDISADAYHADPCATPSLSRSIAKILLTQTPRHAWQAHPRLNPNCKPDNAAKFDIGTAAHDLLLGGEGRFVIVDAADWRTKAAKEAREEAYEAGKTPLLVDQWEGVQAMVNAARLQLGEHQDMQHASIGVPDRGAAEQTLIWQEQGVWCRARLDWLPSMHRNGFPDYKTTGASAHPDKWASTGYDTGIDLQAAFYSRGIRAVLGVEQPDFRFVVQETKPPYALSVIALTPQALAMADRKVDAALAIWRQCLEADRWPGYPNQTCYIDPPYWEEKQWLEREERDKAQSETRPDLLQTMIDWQRPL